MADKVAKWFAVVLCLAVFGSLAVLAVVGIWHIIIALD